LNVPGGQPSLQRLAALAAHPPRQQSLDANVFVEIGPFDRVAVAQKPLILTLWQ